MGKVKRNVLMIIKRGEMRNRIKLAAVINLQGYLDTYPEELRQAYKEFIRVIKDNVRARQQLFDEAKDLNMVAQYSRMMDITYELAAIDLADAKATDVCKLIQNKKDWLKEM